MFKKIISAGICTVVMSGLFVQAQTNPATIIGPGFLKTNGDLVTIGNIMVETNSPLNTQEFKEFKWRDYQLMRVQNSHSANALDEFVKGAWALARDYTNRPTGYEDIMGAIGDYEHEGKTAQARALANDLAGSAAPDRLKLWANGALNRLDSYGKPVTIQFTAVDGREVDLANMKGKVVLVDFWATDCGPCVRELPEVKAAYDKFHAQGFEVIGISCDTDREQLQKFVQEKGYPWPQYFDGKQQESNKFAQGFGIDGIPHMFLVDKKGILRFDNVRAGDVIHFKDQTVNFENKISQLLVED